MSERVDIEALDRLWAEAHASKHADELQAIKALQRFEDAMANAFPALAAELEALWAIVARLPKTADGVPIVPGMNLWEWIDGHSLGLGQANIHMSDEFMEQEDISGVRAEWYSTREAAAAADRARGAE